MTPLRKQVLGEVVEAQRLTASATSRIEPYRKNGTISKDFMLVLGELRCLKTRLDIAERLMSGKQKSEEGGEENESKVKKEGE